MQYDPVTQAKIDIALQVWLSDQMTNAANAASQSAFTIWYQDAPTTIPRGELLHTFLFNADPDD